MKGREFVFRYNKDLNKNEYVLTCGGCRTETRMPSKGLGAHFPPEMIAKTFTNKGWEVGRKEGEDRCPACLSKRPQPATLSIPKEGIRTANGTRPKEMEPLPPTVIAHATVAQAAVDQKTIDRENRRKTFTKLSEVYVGDGYNDGWSDNRVAMELGVSRKLVAEIRAEAFGDVATSPEMEAFKTESSKVVQLAAALLDKAKQTVEPLAKLQEEMAALEKQLAAIEATRAAITRMGAV